MYTKWHSEFVIVAVVRQVRNLVIRALRILICLRCIRGVGLSSICFSWDRAVGCCVVRAVAFEASRPISDASILERQLKKS